MAKHKRRTHRGSEHDQANDFARAILMPTDAFKEEVKGGNNTVVGLAKKFQTSTIAVRIRAKELGFNDRK